MSTTVRSPVAEVREPSTAAAGRFAEFSGSPFQLFQPYAPAGDQTQAIAQLIDGVGDGLSYQTLLGVTGSGKTFTMANVIAQLERPALVIAHNKTLAAQLYGEIQASSSRRTPWSISSATTTTTSPKPTSRSATSTSKRTASINEHIDQLRLSATRSLLERRDVVIVATCRASTVSAPDDYTRW